MLKGVWNLGENFFFLLRLDCYKKGRGDVNFVGGRWDGFGNGY